MPFLLSIINFEEKLNIIHNFSKNEDTYIVRNFKLKEKTRDSRKITKTEGKKSTFGEQFLCLCS